MPILKSSSVPQRVVQRRASFPTGAGIVLGVGLAGVVDGIVFHQVLQWHHVASSAGVSVDTVAGLRLNTFLDGLFHALAFASLLMGLIWVWRAARGGALVSSRALIGSTLIGFGLFNLVEGLASHLILGLHHVNETVPQEQWIWWDLVFLASGALLMWIGSVIRRKAPDARGSAR